MIANGNQLIAATPAEAHNSADGTSNKEGYFVILSGVAALPVATLVTSATATRPSGVIVTGYPVSTLPDQIALPGVSGIVKVAIDSTQTTALAYDDGLVITASGTVIKDPGTGARWTVARVVEVPDATTLASIPGQRIMARLIEPVLGS